MNTKLFLGAMVLVLSVSLISCGNKKADQQTDEPELAGVEIVEETKIVCNDTSFVSVFLDIDFSGEIQVFDKPKGKVIKMLRNNMNEEEFIMFDLLEKKDNMFYVLAYSSLNNTLITKGWIYKNNHLGIYSSTYNRDFILYKRPHNKREIIAIDEVYNPNMYVVIDFDGKWLKIKTKVKGDKYAGWISPDEQCSNVYSTCN